MEQTKSKTERNLRNAEPAILQAECDPSLKEDLRAKFGEAGFSSLTDCIRTLARDFNAGRIRYKSGILISQQQTS